MPICQNVLPEDKVDLLAAQLESLLMGGGYLPNDYGLPDGRLVAYSVVPVPLGLEPLLIDDGGTKGRIGPVLKIAVRDADGRNSRLYEGIVRLLRSYGLEPVEDRTSSFTRETVIFGIVRGHPTYLLN